MEADSILGYVNRSVASRLREVGVSSSLHMAFSFGTVSSLGLKMLINLHKFSRKLLRWVSDVGHRTCEERLKQNKLIQPGKMDFGDENGTEQQAFGIKEEFVEEETVSGSWLRSVEQE